MRSCSILFPRVSTLRLSVNGKGAMECLDCAVCNAQGSSFLVEARFSRAGLHLAYLLRSFPPPTPDRKADSIVSNYKSGVGGAWGTRLAGNDRRFSNEWEAQNWLQESIINSSRHGIPVSVYVEGIGALRTRCSKIISIL